MHEISFPTHSYFLITPHGDWKHRLRMVDMPHNANSLPLMGIGNGAHSARKPKRQSNSLPLMGIGNKK